MLISGETARYELTHLNQYCLKKAQYCLYAERVKRYCPYLCLYVLKSSATGVLLVGKVGKEYLS